MPAEARPRVRKLPSGKWQLRFKAADGSYKSGVAHDSKTAAFNYYNEHIGPDLEGKPQARRDVTLQQLADTFLDRHASVAKPRTIQTLRGRLSRPVDEFGDVALSEFERMTDEVAGFASRLPERYRYAVVSALRQTCEAGVRYGYMKRNHAKLAGKNPQPAPRGKTARSRREVPLTTVALEALDSLPARIDSPYVFGPTRRQRDESGELVKLPFDVATFRRRKWGPAIEAAGIEKPARIYDLRSTFASNALAAGITTFELARIMGTSVGMIEAHYGALIDTAHEES